MARPSSSRSARKSNSTARRRLPTPGAGITRVDQESTRTHGYVARLNYRSTDNGWRPKHTAFFGDASHGGPKSALEAAETWARHVRRTGRPPRAKR